MTLKKLVENKAKAVKAAGWKLYNLSAEKKNSLLFRIASGLLSDSKAILKANALDMSNGKKSGLSGTLLDRLLINEKRIEGMIAGIKDVIALPDPVGTIHDRNYRPNGLKVEKMRVPLGAIGIIYEARPNVTIDAAVLCLKAGNSVLLRGGSEAINSNRALVKVLKKAVKEEGLPVSCVEFIDTTDRTAVKVMIKQDKYLDVIIPRGGQSLIKYIIENSSVPVIAHGEGNCHIYVGKAADLKAAEEIVFNAKTQRPSVCNAAEKLLVHKDIARKFIPSMLKRLADFGVEIRADKAVRAIYKKAKPAVEADWYKEYHDLIIGVKQVSSIEEAIKHINTYGSHHSDAIVSRDKAACDKFIREVDSSAVFSNASTRFNDGFELGLGAEIGISTQKLHARGPMGLLELTSSKFVVIGNGQVRK
ncbi:MAG: glutamate-5-semialdehyde dehydrogenase [Candidatus Firestonebacteria bacterium RIFOXYC2_FULL_39_67]|nr:MAG: glutamate-5-semialdehyde dehydrogenase [Candidatus Firestonebacteria bacterium RIFOXYD2_FULL_39_29]OGF54442.1 MAG: glutamate-5-semialdehyde dehydrogenase [Candidatus Firestonebacteria bacterium RIFOXYC2_FULL_39_67]